jgi:hypothetical protein
VQQMLGVDMGSSSEDRLGFDLFGTSSTHVITLVPASVVNMVVLNLACSFPLVT